MLTVFHLVALDLNIYWEQLSEQAYREAQLRWLELDLSAANRNRQAVPWIVVMGHIPLVSSIEERQNPPSCLALPHVDSAAAGCCPQYCALCSQANVTTNYPRAGGWWARHELEPLLLRHGADVK